jgi:uncharacterized protein
MKWYKDGLKFECTQCGRCCTGSPGFVWITMSELYRMAEFLGMRDRDFAKKYVRRVGDRMSLIELSNGDCVFYEKGCKIYPARPNQCRTFPFWPENLDKPSSWDRAATDCPGMNDGPTHSMEEIEKLLQEP